MWANYGFSPTRLRSTSAGRNGSFRMTGLPAGDYLVRLTLRGDSLECLTANDPCAKLFGLALGGFVGRRVEAAWIHGHGHENLAQHDGRRRRELSHVRVVVLVRLFFGHRHAAEDFDLLDVRIEHLPLHIPSQVRHRHALLLEGGLQLLVVLDFVLRLEIVQHAFELVVGELVAELLAALDQQHFVHRAHQQAGRDLVQRLAQLGVALFRREVDGLPLRAQGLYLAGFEIGLGQDLAVHFHENLFDDLGTRDGCHEQSAR